MLCLATLAMSAPLGLEEEWQQWKLQHSKSYADEVEESMRRAVWFRAYHLIKEHNSQRTNSYHLSLNAFSDMVKTSNFDTYPLVIFGLMKDT